MWCNNILPAKTHTPRDPQIVERTFGYYLFNYDAGTKLKNRAETVRKLQLSQRKINSDFCSSAGI
jgi:hypothetical protein